MRETPEPLDLTAAELRDLKRRYKRERKRRLAERLLCLILFAQGESVAQIERILMVGRRTLVRWIETYREQGVEGLGQWGYQGPRCQLTDEQWAEVEQELARKAYHTAKEVAAWVKERFQVAYTERGMQALLRRKGYRWIKTRLVPGKAVALLQQAFVADYEKRRATFGDKARFYFVDAVHPTHNVKRTYVWTKKGQRLRVRSNTGRKRYNILGAYCPQDREYLDLRGTENIRAQTLIQLMDLIRQRHPEAEQIFLILDNVPYHHARLVQDHLADTNVQLLFLPAYAPNLNLIERLWGFLKEKALADYHATFDEFVAAIARVLDHLSDYEEELASLLTEKFEILACA